MDKSKAKKIIESIDGWKTIIGAVGTPIASVITFLTPKHTLANQISVGFTLLFCSAGLAGVFHKYKKGELPNQKLHGDLED